MNSGKKIEQKETLFKKPHWLCFSDIRNYLKDTPLLDWLEHYKGKHEFKQSKATKHSFGEFIMQRGIEFEDWVVHSHIKPLFKTHQFSDLSKFTRAQHKQHLQATIDAFQNTEILVVYQPLLIDKREKWFGHPDLVVHGSAINKIVEYLATLSGTEYTPLEGFDDDCERWVIIDTKFSSSLTNRPLYQAQLLLYSQMVNSTQTNESDKTRWDDLFLLGRTGVLVPAFTSEKQVEKVVQNIKSAREWIARLYSAESTTWNVAPVPSIPELCANLCETEDSPWNDAVEKIGQKQGEITAVYKVGIAARKKLTFPTLPWWNPKCNAQYLLGAKTNQSVQATVNDLLNQARLVRDGKPEQCSWPLLTWKDVGYELGALSIHREMIFVDFEFVYDLHLFESFKNPEHPTKSWVFAVASCTSPNTSESFRSVLQSEDGELSDDAEMALWSRWLSWLQEIQGESTKTLYLVHWSSAELQCVSRLRKKVAERSADALKAQLETQLSWLDRCTQWIDLMAALMRSGKVIPGSLSYALKDCYPALPKQDQEDGTDSMTEAVSNGNQASVICYQHAMEKKFMSPPSKELEDMSRYNLADTLMMRAIWNKVVQL